MPVKSLSRRSAMLLAIAACGYLAPTAHAYVDLAPNLSKIIADSQHIALVEVVSFDHEKHRLTLKEIKSFKGPLNEETVVHEVVPSDNAAVPRHILEWADTGARAVLFVSGKTAMLCHGRGWYQAQAITDKAWKLGMERPDLPLAYYGTVSRLADAIPLMLAGKDAILTTVPHGADEAASFDLALNRAALPGLVKVQRIRANMKMPAVVMAVSASPAYLLGQGALDPLHLPALLEKLHDQDPAVRAESAEDAGSLAARAAAALPALRELLSDPEPRVRMAAAAAILRIAGHDAPALAVLTQGLGAKDTAARRAAARASSFAGNAAAPLTLKLAALLKDEDESTRIAAVEALATLGKAAAQAAPALKLLLDDPSLAIDAADALGRIGPAARPVPEAMIKMLDSDQPAVRWAAVRGMSQIGGQEAHPAVDFMIKELPRASEVDKYNMHIYLALLGPVAKDAIPAIRNSGLRNPILPAATLWAIDPDKAFPWQTAGRAFMMNGPMGDGGPDISKFIYEAYISELGERLKPAGEKLRKAILDGTAGEVPPWGYRLLTCDLQSTLAALEPRLADPDLAQRERAAVALGYMGPSALPAKPQLQSAEKNAPTQKEKKLLAWALKHIDPE